MLAFWLVLSIIDEVLSSVFKRIDYDKVKCIRLILDYKLSLMHTKFSVQYVQISQEWP